MNRVANRCARVVVWVLVSTVVWGLLASALVRAEDEWAALIEELLERPAPAADWRAHAPYRDAPPPDDAPLEVLAAWWHDDDNHDLDDVEPSDAVRRRLLEAVEQHPRDLGELVFWLPKTSEAHAVVERLLGDLGGQMSEEWRENVELWLASALSQSDDELFARAANARTLDGEIEGEYAMEDILQRDRVRARATLVRLGTGVDRRVRALALALLYGDSVLHELGSAELERVSLQEIASDREYSAESRCRAIDVLMASDWAGRDEWFLGLFTDESLREESHGTRAHRALVRGVRLYPDRLIPRVAALVGGEDLTAHAYAVECLVSLYGDAARPDALRPLLPWLTDPTWPDGSSYAFHSDRRSLLSGLARVRLPDSVPGLIHVLQNDAPFGREAAAGALAFQADARAVPALRERLPEESSERMRRSVLQALAACGGFTVHEQVEALEAFARQVSTEAGAAEWRRLWSSSNKDVRADPRVSLGAFLSDGERVDDAVVERLWSRADGLELAEVATSRSIRHLLAAWPHAAAARRVVEAIRNRSADARVIVAALERRDSIGAAAGEALRACISDGGVAGGIAAVLLGEDVVCNAILRSEDRAARTALLAAARLTRVPLPVVAVGALMESDDLLLARAAESYLVAEDSPEARRLVLARHPEELLILGARSAWDPGHFSFHGLDAVSRQLVTAMRRADAPDEILALLSAGYFGDKGQGVLYVRGDGAELVQRLDESRYRRRVLDAEEWTALRRFLERSRFFDLPPLTTEVWDGVQYEAIHLTRERGRRVFMNNPGSAGTAGSAYHIYVRHFQRLASHPTSPIRYDIVDVMPEVRVELAGKRVFAVRGDEHGIRVRIRGGESEGWRLFEAGELGESTSPPKDWPDEALVGMNETFMRSPRSNSPWQARLGDGVVLAGRLRESTTYSPGLRLLKLAGGSELIRRGSYAHPIVTPDGAWVLAAKSGRGGWAKPNTVVRVRMSDREELTVELPAAQTLRPVAWVASRSAVLLERDDEDGSDEEFSLCDPATGATTRVTGEFAPWFHAQAHPLQPTGAPDEVWAALPGDDETRVGRYSTSEFAFTTVATYPRLRFNSASVWVDEKTETVYVALNGDLLGLPLSP